GPVRSSDELPGSPSRPRSHPSPPPSPRLGRGSVAVASLLIAAAAAAEPLDQVEHIFGATNVNAALGDGHLTAGVARTGELTVLRWPGPGGPDHLRYVTVAEPDPT